MRQAAEKIHPSRLERFCSDAVSFCIDSEEKNEPCELIDAVVRLNRVCAMNQLQRL